MRCKACIALTAIFAAVFLQGCSSSGVRLPEAKPVPLEIELGEKGSRDNGSVVLTPVSGTTEVYENEYCKVDASNKADGYIIVHYIGESAKVKLQLTGPNGTTYTYSLATGGGKDEVFPLCSGDGDYTVGVYENIQQNQYATVFSETLSVALADEFFPFLYPNQYVSFNENNSCIGLARDLAYSADSDLDVISSVYNYIISHVVYDYEKAENVQSGYLPDTEDTLATGKGICLDYAVLMTSMLRSQRIPTRMEVGYAGTAYHAWLSTYVTDVGWINGMIEFDGHDWSLMDPTFASTTETSKLKDFIGDGENYSMKYIY